MLNLIEYPLKESYFCPTINSNRLTERFTRAVAMASVQHPIRFSMIPTTALQRLTTRCEAFQTQERQ